MGGLLGSVSRITDSRTLRAEYDRRHRLATVAMERVPQTDLTAWTQVAKRWCRGHQVQDRCWQQREGR